MNTVTTTAPTPARVGSLTRAWTAARLALHFAFATGLGIGTGLALTLTVPAAFRGQALTVMSGSMEPAIRTGDVVVTKPIAPLDARVGDIITFRSPEGDHRLLTHRVRQIRAKGGRVYFVTKGDAVDTIDRWSVPVDGRLARTVVRVEKLGYAVHWINRPLGRMVLFLVPLLALVGFALARIWRRSAASANTSDAHEAPALEPDPGRDLPTAALVDGTDALAEPSAAGGSAQPAQPFRLLVPALLVGGSALVLWRSISSGSRR